MPSPDQFPSLAGGTTEGRPHLLATYQEEVERTEVGGELLTQCEKLRELILGDRIPKCADEDRKRMQASSEAIAARGDWHLDQGTTYHRTIMKCPNPKCPVPLTDAERHFRSVRDPVVTPENTFIPPKEDSPSYIPPPVENSLNPDGSFSE
jgi:hypothetical protein